MFSLAPSFAKVTLWGRDNPCQPHWQLALLPEDYKWWSAMFYEKILLNHTIG